MRCGPPCRLWLVWSALRERREQTIGQSVLGQEEEGKKGGDGKGTDSVPEKYSRSFPGICPPAHALLPAPAPQKQAGGIGRIHNRARRSRGAHDEDADLNATEFLRCNSRHKGGTRREGRVSGRGRGWLTSCQGGGRRGSAGCLCGSVPCWMSRLFGGLDGLLERGLLFFLVF